MAAMKLLRSTIVPWTDIGDIDRDWTRESEGRLSPAARRLRATFRCNDIAALEAAVTDKTAAIMLEMVQAEGGVIPVDPDFVKHVDELVQRARHSAYRR